MSNRSNQPFGPTRGGAYSGGDYIPGLGQQYQEPAALESDIHPQHNIARPYHRSEHEAQHYRYPPPLPTTNRGDDVFTESHGIPNPMFASQRGASQPGGSSTAPWSLTQGQPTASRYEPQYGYQSTATGDQGREHHREGSVASRSLTSSPAELTVHPQAENWSAQARISHNAGDIHSAMPRDLFEMAMTIGRLEAELAREVERALHFETVAKRYKRQRDEVQRALALRDAQAAVGPNQSRTTLSSGGFTSNLNQTMATPHGQLSTMNTPWRATGSTAWRSVSSGISPTPAGDMAVALRAPMPMRGNVNPPARFGIMSERALFGDIFQKCENWGAANATLPIGSEAEGDQARSLIAGAMQLCGVSAYEEIMNGSGTRKHLVAAFINRIFVSEVFTVRSARKSSNPQFSEMIALQDSLRNLNDHDIAERGRIIQKIAETYASITTAKGYQYARDKMIAEITADVNKQLEPMIPPARRSIAFDDMLALTGFALRAAERFLAVSCEWILTFEHPGNRFDIHTMVSRDERFNGDARLHQEGQFQVTLGISPSVTRRDLSRGVVVPEMLQKPQVLIEESHKFAQRAISGGSAS